MNSERTHRPGAIVLALSADASWIVTAREGHIRGRVHSVFDRVVNVSDDEGELFSVATRTVDNGPNTLIVDAPTFANRMRRGDPVTESGGMLTIAEHTVIALEYAAVWHPRRTPYAQDDVRLQRNLALARAHPSTAFARDMQAGPADGRARLRLLCARLGDALSDDDRDAARVHGRALLGLGPGLTPSGDDFLVGLFAVLHIDQSPCSHLRDVCAGIIEGVDERTNAISAAALKAAAQGRVRESIDALLTELMTGKDERVPASLGRVLAIGSTSGADIVGGIVAGFDANLHATESRSVRVDG